MVQDDLGVSGEVYRVSEACPGCVEASISGETGLAIGLSRRWTRPIVTAPVNDSFLANARRRRQRCL